MRLVQCLELPNLGPAGRNEGSFVLTWCHVKVLIAWCFVRVLLAWCLGEHPLLGALCVYLLPGVL